MKELKARGDSLAMIISDQRMPGIQGTEVLTQTRDIYPIARRIMLTAYSDIDAAINAINKAHLDYYLSKPWYPPEECLYPGGGRSARCLAGRIAARSQRAAPRRASVVAAVARDQGLPREQSDPVPLARHRTRGRRRACCSRPPASPPRNCPRCFSKTDPCCAIPNRVRSRSVWADRCRRR